MTLSLMIANCFIDRIKIYIVGILPTITQNKGYIVVVITSYTRCSETFALEYQYAYSVALPLLL